MKASWHCLGCAREVAADSSLLFTYSAVQWIVRKNRSREGGGRTWGVRVTVYAVG